MQACEVGESPPAKEGKASKTTGVVVLWSSKGISIRLPKNNHPMPPAFPLLRRRGVLAHWLRRAIFLLAMKPLGGLTG